LVRSSAGWACVPLLAGCLMAVLPGCASSPQSFVWVDDLNQPEPPAGDGQYVIGVGDVLSVQVWDQEKMSGRVRVRTDGRVSLPLLNDVEAAGKTPVQLAREFEGGLKSVVLNPKVTVVVEESMPLSISILGEVARPGLHALNPGAGVAQALAAAGGLTTFAHKNRIFVLRSGPTPARIRFTYKGLTDAPGPSSLFRLRTGDVVVVE